MMEQNQREFLQLFFSQESEKLEKITNLYKNFYYLEKVIGINIDQVDERILPDLKDVMNKIQEKRGEIEAVAPNETQIK